jgi:hypothetical protein
MSASRLWLAFAAVATLSLASCGAPQQKQAEAPAPVQVDPATQRVRDLVAVNESLQRYHATNGSYPVSTGFQGYASSWGAALGADWIPGLQTTPLPRDPSMSETGESQYVYFSNGADYKLIAIGTDDCGPGIEQSGVRIDPKRRDESRCWAYGFWSPGGEDF